MMNILNDEMEREMRGNEEMEDVERMVRAAINTTKRLLERKRKERRNQPPQREKIERLKEAIRKEDLLALKKMGVKGKKKQLMKRGMRKLKKLQLQQELETGQSEMLVEERKRIASNAILFRFGKKMRRRNEDEETPDPQRNIEFWRGLYENGEDVQHDEREETPTRVSERIALS